ncbi:MAG: hypothetical protein K6G54_06985 [Oscillospiraceae bacterium]|nr:hypothetical protein [Oscillospiraceae bacterium]
MKTRLLPLLMALVLVLSACTKTPAPDAPDDPAPTAPDVSEVHEPLALETLSIEFTVGERDADALLALQKTFPAALTDALAQQSVSVGTVEMTFGVSGAATETALESGAVQLAFLAAEDYFLYRNGEIVAVEQCEDTDGMRSLLVSGVAEPRLTEALRAALPALAEQLAAYTSADAAGVYTYDEAAVAALKAQYE